MSETILPPPPGVPVGRVYEEPRLKDASQEEKELYLRGVVANGPPREGPVLPAETPQPAPSSGIFDPNTLLLPLEGRSERFTMPDGTSLWVHPASLEDAARANRLALSEVKKLGLMTEGKQEEAQLEARMRAMVYQVVYVCRTGAKTSAPLVFQEQHAAALRRNPGYVEAVQQICAISDRLAEGKSEADLLRESFADFFGAMEKALATFSSDETSNCSPALRKWLADFAHSVSVLRQRSRLSANDIGLLRSVIARGTDADGQ